MSVISISGVGGTGKTTVARLLAKKLDYKLIELNKIAENKRFYLGYDKKRKSKIVDMDKLKKEVKRISKKDPNLVLEGLYAHEFPSDFLVVLRCNPKILEKRLKKKYSWHTKITENLEAEIMGMITYEALQRKKKVFEIDTSQMKPQQVVIAITKILSGSGSKYKVGNINWME